MTLKYTLLRAGLWLTLFTAVAPELKGLAQSNRGTNVVYAE